ERCVEEVRRVERVGGPCLEEARPPERRGDDHAHDDGRIRSLPEVHGRPQSAVDVRPSSANRRRRRPMGRGGGLVAGAMLTLLHALIQFPQEIPDIARSTSEALKVWLALAGIGLLLAWSVLRPTVRRWVLVVLVVFAGLTYLRFGGRLLFQNTDNYDLFHYYLNSKYFDELGYFDLYPAGMLVDHENGGPKYPEGTRYLAQDESGHHWEPIGHALARAQIVKQKFTPERWQEFTHDALALQREKGQFDGGLWRQMIQDHGFNGTPAWVALARPIADVVPIEHKKALCWIDIGLLAVGVGAIGWAYGAEAALWTLFFLFTTYS